MADKTLLYYEPKEDGYARVFGSFDDVYAYIEWDEFGFVQTDENTILIYGYATLFKGIRKLKKTDDGYRQDDDWKFEPQLVKFEIHKDPWKDKKGERTPQCHERFMFGWLHDCLVEGKIYKGKTEFNPGYESIYQKIINSTLTSNLDEELLKLCIDVVLVESPEKVTTKPSMMNEGNEKKGKSFKSKFEQAKEMFPELFKDCKTLEECVHTVVIQYTTYQDDLMECLTNAIIIKSCFGYDVPFECRDVGNVETQPSKPVKVSVAHKQLSINKPLSDSVESKKFDFSDLIAQSNIELKRLNWSAEDAQKELQERYGKTSRQLLTDEQMLDFVKHLESTPAF